MFKQAFGNIDDILHKVGCTAEFDHTEQASRLLFLKYLDGVETDDGKADSHILDKPCRSEAWAALNGKIDYNKVRVGDNLRDFVSGQNITR
jgi:hypothetical protein